MTKETVRDARVTYTLERDGKFYIIENVPARVCVETGEEFFDPANLGRDVAWGQMRGKGGGNPLPGSEHRPCRTGANGSGAARIGRQLPNGIAVRVIAHASSRTTLAIANRIVESSSAGTAVTPSFAAIHWPPRASDNVA